MKIYRNDIDQQHVSMQYQGAFEGWFHRDSDIRNNND